MTYHALQPPGTGGAEGPRWAVGAARSTAGHALGPYEKAGDGPVLCGGGPGSWDESGIGTRHVVHAPDGQGGLVMVYEGVGGDGRHRLGLATSVDGLAWTKVEGVGPEPGGPIFEGAPKESDGRGITGTLYYVGTSDKGRSVAIGCAESDELLSSTWERVKATS
ncbi:hypothetical protein EMIHUDRAFT_247247 [Emiliania huxleyi CCMP1516]|uniref:Glycosyl hydrolase family 32 N-terminal domain-containing protein n=2 Tax=Emiliania huxleyi TaxID=2903 RepID=A0A0D3INF3_EMIH1|nr:hypothetical protein EMIHUDRAFT_247247 [Emiliania huxleyi CCMP1516]EOD12788.1 hypothetical protein EMIHUDRAFT_247247 [Emiliania huxleyi CCMP1516]|eukprot:XP_005765217.1 hypothetical protein EMIHUDRAFT_247247 [Emiliania huxleyi CCMP1516]